MIILDIGCGKKKIAGSIGIDFSIMSDADVFIDLNNQPLPFSDNSVDFIYSSHTLEHLTKDGFLFLMRETYRVLKPFCQFNILVPYFTSTANFANPFHNNNICFNEHTFRFFSSEVDCIAIPKQEYQTPSCPQWGLRYSANSELNMEFRTLRIDKFYFPKYSEYNKLDKTQAFQSKLNVVEQISYSLQAIKPCPSRPDIDSIIFSEDLHLVVSRMLPFLSEQIIYLEKYEINSLPEIDQGKELSKAKKHSENDLYIIGNVLVPVNFLIFKLDYVIQLLRSLIDKNEAKIFFERTKR
jgi:SAM-dependent methyltransferase